MPRPSRCPANGRHTVILVMPFLFVPIPHPSITSFAVLPGVRSMYCKAPTYLYNNCRVSELDLPLPRSYPDNHQLYQNEPTQVVY